jgi:hypothetical protein
VSITRRIVRQGRWIAAAVVAASLVATAVAAAAPSWTQPSRTTAGPVRTSALVNQLQAMRLATAKYATSLDAAKRDGYQIITKMIPDMGLHFMNPSVKGFDPRKPPILVYEHHNAKWQLAALEWVFTSKPDTPPLPGAQYGSFGAGCHYADGTFVPADSQDLCPKVAPDSGAPFTFWHPLLVTLHVWIWYPNPTGLYASTNPFVTPFNNG